MAKKQTRRSPEPDDSFDFRDAHALTSFLEQLLRKSNRPLNLDMLLQISHLPRKAKRHVQSALFAMLEAGAVLRGAGGWALAGGRRLVSGRLAVPRGGMGFVTPEGGGEDVYVHASALNGAWPGDRVEVVLLPGKRGPSKEGRVVRVLERGLNELPAHALKPRQDGTWLCAPVDPRIPALFYALAQGLEKDVREGDLLLLRPESEEGPNLWRAAVTANLEHERSPAAQERITKLNHAVPVLFPAKAVAEAGAFAPDPDEASFAGREDLRPVPFVTIDGRTAKDFDDAIHVEESGGRFRLRVAIADVSHYVRQGSALDREALLRGNSYYFAMSVEPMLPEALSNGLCSLKPGVPRLAMVADMYFSGTGERESARFYPAVIVSAARLTYGQIERALLLADEEEQARLGDRLPMLRAAEELARRLGALRRARGALDFNLPEPEIRMGADGTIASLGPARRHFGHKLIEECMIAANEAVASFLESRNEALLFRVHQPPEPEKLRDLLAFIESGGLADFTGAGKGRGSKRKTPSALELQQLLAASEDAPEGYTVTRLLLRAMMQARYQTDNEGHFGLASPCYCHFTSPIRRYADLAVHRALKRAIGFTDGEKEGAAGRKRLEETARHINLTERKAMEAERELFKRFAALYLEDRVGETFKAVVSGVSEFGLFVELRDILAEGMIRFASLGDDYYEFLPERQELRGRRTRRSFRLGQPLAVTLTDVSLSRLEISFALAGENGRKKSAAGPPKGVPAKKSKKPLPRARAGTRRG